VFGRVIKPVNIQISQVIGGETVHPEINFALLPLRVTSETMDDARHHYCEALEGGISAANRLIPVNIGEPTSGLSVPMTCLTQLKNCPTTCRPQAKPMTRRSTNSKE